MFMLVIGMVPNGDASFVPSALNPGSQQGEDLERDRIQQLLETKMVKARLEKLGFTSEEIQSRLTNLTDEQIHYLAHKLDDLKVAGDGLGVVISLLVIAILVVVLLQLTGHKVIIR